MWYNGTILYKDVTSMPEMLDIVDENGIPTGRSVPRTVAHAEGLRHRTSHVWIVRREFHGKPFKDNQVSKVFCLWLDREAEDFAVQKSEIDYVKWFDLEEAMQAVRTGTIPNCIFLEELEMVRRFVAG